MTDFTTTWFDCSKGVLDEHSDVEVRQRYLFIFTKDKHIVVVSKDGKEGKWQFPGGHPNDNENWEKTLIREVWEETGLNVENNLESIQKLGYYLVEFPEENFLQERYVVIFDELAEKLKLETNEDSGDEDAIQFVKTVPISEIKKYVSWAPEVEGWNKAVEYFAEKFLLNVFNK